MKHPNLIFTFENPATSCCGGPWGSWVSTIFSTAQNKVGKMGTIAIINGVTMGQATPGKATGRWIGLKQGTGSSNAPIIRGLAWIHADFKSQPPYGNSTLVSFRQACMRC